MNRAVEQRADFPLMLTLAENGGHPREWGSAREWGQFESSEKPYRAIVDLGAGPGPAVHSQRFVRELHCGRCSRAAWVKPW